VAIALNKSKKSPNLPLFSIDLWLFIVGLIATVGVAQQLAGHKEININTLP
jgi:hypothetical protein